jgi:hypothetical protein
LGAWGEKSQWPALTQILIKIFILLAGNILMGEKPLLVYEPCQLKTIFLASVTKESLMALLKSMEKLLHSQVTQVTLSCDTA